jgi:hypothetical protein
METTTYVVREGVHGEWCIDRMRMSCERMETLGRAITRQEAEKIVRELNYVRAAKDSE